MGVLGQSLPCTSYWSTASTVLGEAGTPASVQLAPTTTHTHPPTLQIVRFFFRRLRSVSEAPRSQERWTKLLSLSSLYFHSARAPGRRASHLLPRGCEQYQQCWQVSYDFWHHCLGKLLRDSRSAATSYLKLSPKTLFQDRFYFIETDDLALHITPETLSCAQD